MLSDSTILTLNGSVAALRHTGQVDAGASLKCGVDLGTASIVEVVLTGDGRPVACEIQPCQIARDGLVVDYFGAIQIVKRLTDSLRRRLDRPIEQAAIAVPPGTSARDCGTHRHVVEAAGLEVAAIVDEPTAANSVLGVVNGVVVDIGGGTTGLSVFEDSKVVYVADEATGGTHMSLVLMGRFGLTFDEAEKFKADPDRVAEVKEAVRPVAEKMATIVGRHLAGGHVENVWLVGGSAGLDGMEEIFADHLGVPVHKPPHPMMVTPVGIAMNQPS
ncbi:MAG: ethanolamine utilization protein EutJ [Propionibacteriaceae bacterium]|nr:ethanolamine utilization protein EutJ [Propionibacteriaceae bacterium]